MEHLQCSNWIDASNGESASAYELEDNAEEYEETCAL